MMISFIYSRSCEDLNLWVSLKRVSRLTSLNSKDRPYRLALPSYVLAGIIERKLGTTFISAS